MSISKRKKYSTCSNSMRTSQFIHKVKQTIDENWGQSMRSIAKKLHVSEKTIRRSVHEDIRYKFYMMKRIQFISEKSKENRLKRAKRFLNKLENLAEAGVIWFFSDEKNVDQDQDQKKKKKKKKKKINRRNDRWLRSDPSSVPRVTCKKCLSTVMD